MAKRKSPAEDIATRDIPALSLRATVRADSVDAEARTVEVLWTTGARVLRGFFNKFYEELSLDPAHVRLGRLNGGAPFLNSHNSYDLDGVIGVVEAGTARVNGKEGTATIRFPKADDDENADRIFRKVQDGIIRNISVGYRIHRFEQVEGGDDEIPVYRAVDWEPYELSAVPMGADAGAGFRSAEQPDTNDCVFVTRGVQQEKTMTEEEKKAAAEKVAAEKRAAEQAAASAQASADADAIRKEAQEAERARVTGIHQAVRTAKLGDELADELIRAGTSLDKARETVLAKLAEKDGNVTTDPHHRAAITEDERDKWVRGASDWLLTKAGVADTVVAAAKARGETVKVDAGEFRGLSLLDLARESLTRAGVNVRGLDKMALAGMALTRANITQSTSDFAVLLENTMHKVLLAAYGTTPDTWSRFCSVGSVSDFRPHNRYRMGTFGRLDKVNENGEFKNKSIPDGAKEVVQAATYGNIINLSRQAIINDDMGSFNRLATMLGRAARLSIEVDVYALLAENAGLGPDMQDTNPLFHDRGTGSNNIGTASTIAVEAIDADRVVMASMKDPSGNEFLDLRPAVLLVPIGIGGTARVINDAQYDPDTASKLQRPNKVRGLFRDIVDTPRLSGTRRYLFADPSVAPTIEVFFLEGQQTPFLENQNGWRVDGVEWKVRLDYGVDAVDYRGAVTNAGTP